MVKDCYSPGDGKDVYFPSPLSRVEQMHGPHMTAVTLTASLPSGFLTCQCCHADFCAVHFRIRYADFCAVDFRIRQRRNLRIEFCASNSEIDNAELGFVKIQVANSIRRAILSLLMSKDIHHFGSTFR